MSQYYPASPWIEANVNGALADSEVEDFGGAAMAGTTMPIPPSDFRLKLVTLEYGGAAAVAVRIFFATAAGVAAELQKEVVNEASVQYFIWPCVYVPRDTNGLPYTMRITKAATNARLGYFYQWVPSGGC